MEGRKGEYSRGNPCPICGKPDMCFYSDRGPDGILRICGRMDMPETTGVNGRRYKRIKSSGRSGINTYASYVDAEEDFIRQESARKKWCEEHGYRFRPKSEALMPEIDRYRDSMEEYAAWRRQEETEPLDNGILDVLYREWLSSMILAPAHKDRLMLEWACKPEMAEGIFKSHMIRTMPPEDGQRSMYARYWRGRTGGPSREMLVRNITQAADRIGLPSLQGIPGLYRDEKTGEWQICARSGIVFPVYDMDGHICRLRIGVDAPSIRGEYRGREGIFFFHGETWFFSAEGGKGTAVWREGGEKLISLNRKGVPPGKPMGKYVNLSSYKEIRDEETKTIKNRYCLGTRSGSQVSVYRPNCPKPGVAWITEGEKKAMVICQLLNVTVICLPGTKTFGKIFDGGQGVFARLLHEGTANFVIAYDADKEKNEMVKKDESALAMRLLGGGARVFIADWNIQFGKGLDDALLNDVMPILKAVRKKG